MPNPFMFLKPLWPVLVVLALALVIVAIIGMLRRGGGKRLPEGNLPYRRKDYLLSKAERNFYEVLLTTLRQTDSVVFCKVRLLDLVRLPTGTANRQGHLNRVMSKHVDFVLCTRQEIRPVLVLELDDASHDAEDRQQRDAFVDRVLAAAELPILHIRASDSYSPQQLGMQIHKAVPLAARR